MVRHVNATHVVVTASVHLATPAHYMFQNDARAATLASSTVFTNRLPVARHLVPLGGPREQRDLVAGAPPVMQAHAAAPMAPRPGPGRGPVLHEPAWAQEHLREGEAARREQREREAMAERRRGEGHRE